MLSLETVSIADLMAESQHHSEQLASIERQLTQNKSFEYSYLVFGVVVGAIVSFLMLNYLIWQVKIQSSRPRQQSRDKEEAECQGLLTNSGTADSEAR